MDLEGLIKYKTFVELTDQERSDIQELAKNEVEFNDLKSFLLSADAFYTSHKVKASQSLRNNVMDELYASPASKAKWYSSFFSYLFPENKSFVQYPAFQFSVLAIVLIGFFTLFENPFETEKLALVEADQKVEQSEVSDSISPGYISHQNGDVITENEITENDMEDIEQGRDERMDNLNVIELNEKSDNEIPPLPTPAINNNLNFTISSNASADIVTDFDQKDFETSNTFYDEVTIAPIDLDDDLTVQEPEKLLNEVLEEDIVVLESDKYKKETRALVPKLEQKEINKSHVEAETVSANSIGKLFVPVSKLSILQTKELFDLFFEVK